MAPKELTEKLLSVLKGDIPYDGEDLAEADSVIEGLIENLIRGWGLNQFEAGDAPVLLILCLICARGALQQTGSIGEGIKKVKEEVRGFCELEGGKWIENENENGKKPGREVQSDHSDNTGL